MTPIVALLGWPLLLAFDWSDDPPEADTGNGLWTDDEPADHTVNPEAQ